MYVVMVYCICGDNSGGDGGVAMWSTVYVVVKVVVVFCIML